MAYIGRGIENLINAQKLDAITPSTATGVGPYNLTQNSVAFVPASADALVVSINGVVQYGNFTISGSTITFSGALTDADTCDFIYQMGTGLLNTPADGTVNTAQLADGGVTNVKLGTDISASKITTGTLADARIPNLDTSKITTGTLDAARIDNNSLANVTALPFSVGTDWQSTIVTGTTLTAEAGKGYWINTTSNACTVTLPASASVGDSIQIVDYAGTFATNFITLTSSLNINGATDDKALTTNREGVTITYVDATQGWVATSGVNSGDQALGLPPYSVDFLVIAGGGGGGSSITSNTSGGGGGGGGYRNSYSTETSGGNSSSEASLSFITGTVYTVTVGAGGAGGAGVQVIPANGGANGSNSSISGTGIATITSTGGGGGGAYQTASTSGGSGGGGEADDSITGASGTANQGFAGGNGGSNKGGGGGGASSVGVDGSSTANGGNGLSSSITGSSTGRAGGGGGGREVSGTAGTGSDGGGNGGTLAAGSNATVNTGSGGGGSGVAGSGTNAGGNGGKGVVILRMPTANYSGTTTGSPTVTTDGTDTVIVFNDSGSITG